MLRIALSSRRRFASLVNGNVSRLSDDAHALRFIQLRVIVDQHQIFVR